MIFNYEELDLQIMLLFIVIGFHNRKTLPKGTITVTYGA